ncbi:MAG: hypothetical protein AAFZ63_12465 [Bacteroidota bacterium]
MNRQSTKQLPITVYILFFLLLSSCGGNDWNAESLDLDYQTLMTELADRQAWFTADEANNGRAYRSYLAAYPDGLFASQAQEKIQGLDELLRHHQNDLNSLQQDGDRIVTMLNDYYEEWMLSIESEEGFSPLESNIRAQMIKLDYTDDRRVYEEYLDFQTRLDTTYAERLYIQQLTFRDTIQADLKRSLFRDGRLEWNQSMDRIENLCASTKVTDFDARYYLDWSLSQELAKFRRDKFDSISTELCPLIRAYRAEHDRLAELAITLQIEE